MSVSTQRMFSILSAHYFLVFKITILQFSFVDLMKMEDETKIWKLLLYRQFYVVTFPVVSRGSYESIHTV